MFETLKHWLGADNHHSDLFQHPEDEIVHLALASLLYHVMAADQDVTDRERHKCTAILQDEFDLSHAQANHLLDQAQTLNTQLSEDLITIGEYLRDNPVIRLQFMDKLNQLVYVDGVSDQELRVFDQVKSALFPDRAAD